MSDQQNGNIAVTVQVLDGSHRVVREEITLDRSFSIGRSQAQEIYIPEQFESVSRLHARIVLDSGGSRFEDEGSSNGSFFKGQRIRELPLRENERYEISLGRSLDGVILQAHLRTKLVRWSPAATVIHSIHSMREMHERFRFGAPQREAAVPVASAAVEHAGGAQERVYEACDVIQSMRKPDEVYARPRWSELRELVGQVCRKEAPISLELLTRRIAPYWGLQKSSSKLCDRVLEVLKGLDFLLVGEEHRTLFIYERVEPPQSLTFYRVPTSDKRTQRTPGDLPAPEIRNAAKRHLRGGA